MTPLSIETSTREERQTFVREKWECMHRSAFGRLPKCKNCELCGKCHILKGRDAEILYADYIDGKRSYIDITLELRKQ